MSRAGMAYIAGSEPRYHNKYKTSTWRFMGSYKWGLGRVTVVITHIREPVTPCTTTHEPRNTLAALAGAETQRQHREDPTTSKSRKLPTHDSEAQSLKPSTTTLH